MEENQITTALLESLKILAENINKQSLDTANVVKSVLTEAFQQQNTNINESLKAIISDKEAAIKAKAEEVKNASQHLSQKDKEIVTLREEFQTQIAAIQQEHSKQLEIQKQQSNSLLGKYEEMQKAFLHEQLQAEKATQSEALSTLLSKHNIIPELRGAVQSLLQSKLTMQPTDNGKVVLFENKPIQEGFSGWLDTPEGKAFQLPEISTGAITTPVNTVTNGNTKPNQFTLPNGEPNLTLIGTNWEDPSAQSIYNTWSKASA